MASTAGTTARTQRLIAAVATCLLGAVTAFAVGRVFLGAAATWRLVFAALISALLACAFERRNLALAAAVSAAALIVVVGWMIFPGTTWHGLPTAETLRAIGHASGSMSQQARVQVSPTPPLQPLMLAALGATWAAVFSAHALAFRAGSPLLALLPPVAILVFADTVLDSLVKPIYGLEFLAAALVVIFADGIRRMQAWGPVWMGPGRGARLTHTAGRGARRVALAAVGMAVISPLLIPGFGSKALLNLSGTAHPGVSVDVLVSVANQLKRGDTVEVFTVQTGEPTYYHLISLPEFDGTRWRPSSDPRTQDIAPGAPLGPVAGLSAVAAEGFQPVTQQFRVSSRIDLPLLPTSYPAQDIDMGGVSVHWDAAQGTASLDGAIDAGTDYSVTSLPVAPTPSQLRSLDTTAWPADRSSLELPVSTPEIIANLAAEWTRDATTMYDKVIAIQDHLVDPKRFTYDDTVPAREDSTAMVEFLTRSGRGFCQQFSSAMGVLLRSIGIPARVAVGFTAGTQDPKAPGTWRVTTDNAHAWVEVFFPEFGWLAFEPTPGRTNPVAAVYADPSVCQSTDCTRGGHAPPVRGPQRTTTGKQAELTEPPPSALTTPKAGASVAIATPRRFTARRILALGSLIAVLIFLLVPVVRAGRRRLRLRRAAASPRRLILTTYDVFTDRAGELGFGRAMGETLEEYLARVTASGLVRNGDLDRLTRLTAEAAYAPAIPEQDAARDATSAAAMALRDIRRGTPLTARMRGRYFPDR